MAVAGLGTPGAAQSLFEHNGSLVRLRSDGASRSFEYVAPRAGLREVGVEAGTVLFEGSLTKDRYSGTAYLFSRGCGRIGYPVQGRASGDRKTIELAGRAPRRSSRCKTVGHREDRLVFHLQPDAASQPAGSPARGEPEEDRSPEPRKPDAGEAPGRPSSRWIAVARASWRDEKGVAHAAGAFSGIMSSREEAIEKAMSGCRAQGAEGCTLAGPYDTGCLYITVGSNAAGSHGGIAETAEEAMRICSEGGFTCRKPVGGCIE
jgi:hypothetical protein